LFFGGLTVAFCYIVGTVCVLLALPSSEVSPLQGLVQAIAKTGDRVGLPYFLPVAAFLIRSATLAHRERIWPPSHVYLLWLALITICRLHSESCIAAGGRLGSRCWSRRSSARFHFLGQAGTSVKGAYDVLVSMGVITYFIRTYICLHRCSNCKGNRREKK